MDYTLIPLTDSLHTILDSEDYEKVSKYKWHLTSHGYAANSSYIGGGRSNARYKTTKMHRLILNLTETDKFVDHINGNRLDNRKVNLRIVNPSQNTMNRGLNSNNKSGYKGVSWRKDLGKWKATIQVNGKSKHLGFYECKHEAAKAYNQMALKAYGKFARLNEIKEVV